MTSSPVLTWFDPYQSTFLKTYWSSEGMVWILMQPNTDKEYHHASTFLKYTGTYLFDLSPHGAWFQPIACGYQSCTDFERKHNSFIKKTPAADGALDKISHISGASIFGGSVTVQL